MIAISGRNGCLVRRKRQTAPPARRRPFHLPEPSVPLTSAPAAVAACRFRLSKHVLVPTALNSNPLSVRACRAIHGAASFFFSPSVPASAVGLFSPAPCSARARIRKNVYMLQSIFDGISPKFIPHSFSVCCSIIFTQMENQNMRRKVFELVEPSKDEGLAGAYNIVMVSAIIASIVPMTFKQTNTAFLLIDRVTTILFIIDYALRWMTADIKLKQKGPSAFIVYPFTPMAIIDLLSILPGLFAINQSLKLFRLIRMVRMFRIFRVFKAFRYSSRFAIIGKVIRDQRDSLIAVCYIAGGYILVAALIIFNVEPQSFDTFFDAIYWATFSLTTVGYGDIYPVTNIGRLVAMISSLFGVAVIALPAGIISAGIMDEINKRKSEKDEKEADGD